LFSFVLEGKGPLDVETDLGSTNLDDKSRGVQEWPPWDDGCLLISTSLYEVLILLRTVVVLVVVVVVVYVLKHLRAVIA